MSDSRQDSELPSEPPEGESGSRDETDAEAPATATSPSSTNESVAEAKTEVHEGTGNSISDSSSSPIEGRDDGEVESAPTLDWRAESSPDLSSTGETVVDELPPQSGTIRPKESYVHPETLMGTGVPSSDAELKTLTGKSPSTAEAGESEIKYSAQASAERNESAGDTRSAVNDELEDNAPTLIDDDFVPPSMSASEGDTQKTSSDREVNGTPNLPSTETSNNPSSPAENGSDPSANPDLLGPHRVKIANRRDGGILYWTAKLYAFALIILLGAAVFTGVFVYSYFANEAPQAPDLSTYASTTPAISRMYAADGTLLTEFAEEWREVVPFEEIPAELVNAFLAAEDHDFYGHKGIYFKGIARAAWRNISAGDFAQGGSTITQQVAKQFLSREKSLTRKAKEAIMARRLEAKYSKDAILSVYLNHIYLGSGAYGVKKAAERYFSKKLEELTVSEMATLAGLAQAPSRYSPTHHPKRAQRRRNAILDKMAIHGFISAEELAAHKEEPLSLSQSRDRFGDISPYYTEHVRRYVVETYGKDALLKDGLHVETAVEPVVDHIAYDNIEYGARKQDKRQGWRGPVASLDETGREIFLKRAEEMYGERALEKGRRYLALVTEVQVKGATVRVGKRDFELPLSNMKWASPWSAVDAVNDVEISDARRALQRGDVVWVKAEDPRVEPFKEWFLVRSNPRWRPAKPQARLERELENAEGRVELDQVPHPQSALFTGDHETGYVPAMVGGTDFDRSVYNRAFQSCRQPGSTYKPIYYSAALAEGYGYNSSLNDIPRAEVDPVTGEVWVPENFQGTSDNKVTLEYAMVFSKNVASVDIFKKVGANAVEAWARRLGFTTEIIADKALALGASCTRLHELTRAFAIFARNGRFLDWVFVRRIVDRDGNLLEDNTVYYDPMLTGSERLDRIYATAGVRATQAIPKRAAFLMTKLLRQTIKSGFSHIVRQAELNAAGKTGTSSATMDNTFVAFTSRWITTVWMGDDIRQRPLGKDDAAYMTVEPMWSRFMKEAAAGHPNEEIPWSVPDGVDPDDRGDHSKGTTMTMPLVYIKSARSVLKDLEGQREEAGE